jgi:hypothetical protein
MRYQKIVSLRSVVLLLICASISTAASDSNEIGTQTPVAYRLIAAKGAGISKLRVENTSDKLQFVYRPSSKDVLLAVEGLGQEKLVVFGDIGESGALAINAIPLQPKCTFEMKLGSIGLVDRRGQKSGIPQGNYIAKVLPKDQSMPDINNVSKVQILVKYIPDVTSAESGKDEYPLGVNLELSSQVYYQGKPVMVNVRLENNGLLPITLLNYFHPYINHFRLEKKYAVSGTKIEEPVHGIEKITPHRIEGWITLLPGESLVVAIDVSNDFKTPGEYLAAITYQHGPIILYATNSKPYYTNQRTWTSKEVDIVISNAPRPDIRKEEQAEGAIAPAPEPP